MMEMVTVKCPNCFGQIQLDKNAEKYFCLYCRKEIKERPKTEEEIALEIKLKMVREIEKRYMRNQKTFGDVMNAFDVAEPVGKYLPLYWLERARFFHKGSLRELNRDDLSVGRSNTHKKYKVYYKDKDKIIENYVVLMDKALEYTTKNKEMLEVEKKKGIDSITAAFGAEQERRGEFSRKDQAMRAKIEEIEKNKMKRCALIALIPGLVVFVVVSLVLLVMGAHPIEGMLTGLMLGGVASLIIGAIAASIIYWKPRDW